MSVQSVTAEQALLAAVEGRCAIEVAWEAATEALSRELDRWLDPSVPAADLDALVLARLVTNEVRWVGKHFLDPARLESLAVIRERHGGRDPYLDAFLGCLLDKHDGHFWNRTYLFIPLLEVLLDEHDLIPSSLAGLLAADIVRYELCAAHRRKDVAPLGRPESKTLRTRVRHSLRFMSAHLGGSESEDLLAAIANEPEGDLAAVLMTLPGPPLEIAGEWLELSVQPVYTVHDEYFFIRVLQAHEMSFAGMNRRMRVAIAALREQQFGVATTLLEEIVAFMDRNASLFRIVATMRPEAFHTFREFTDGASAIQSEQYKRFEGLCGLPPGERIDSPAYESVPLVQAEISQGPDTMTDAYGHACARGRHPDEVARIGALLEALEVSHRRWKGTHVTLATRMLGDARGSGYTSGVGYLQQWVDHRLFWALDPADPSLS